MHREDVEAQRVLDATCSQEELAAALGAIVGSIPPAEMLVLAGQMFPAISLPERAEVLGGIKASAPPQVFAAMASRVRSAIGETEWAALAARIGAWRATLPGRPLPERVGDPRRLGTDQRLPEPVTDTPGDGDRPCEADDLWSEHPTTSLGARSFSGARHRRGGRVRAGLAWPCGAF